MESTVKIDTANQDFLFNVLSKSLDGNKKVDYNLETERSSLKIDIETETLPQLRGCTDTVFRLSSLAEKIFQKY